MSSAAQVHALRRGQIQLGLMRAPVNDEALEAEEIVQESLMVALPENHLLCDKSHLRLTDLAGEAFVICSAEFEPSLYRCYTSLLKQAGFEPRILQEVTHLQTQLGLVASAMGVTLVPSSVARLPRPGIVYREVSCPQVMLPKAAAWIKGLDSPHLKAFLAALRQTATHLQAAPLSIVANAM
jgi:DNA-binding transcriptional LysR family regulator